MSTFVKVKWSSKGKEVKIYPIHCFHFLATGKYQLTESSQSRLSLKDPAELRIDFRITNNPKVIGPEEVGKKFGQNGGGVEYRTTDPVQVDIIRIRELR